jgi:xanthine dehydrogenase accessory factor
VQEQVFAAVVRAFDRGEAAALITIVSTRGSTPQRVGAKMLVHADGRTVGTIGGGCYESDAAGKARECIRTREAAVVRYDLSDSVSEDSGLICGGQMEVFIEPLDPSPRLFIAGAGHVSAHLARIAAGAGFAVHIVDDRARFASRERFPDAATVDAAEIATFLAAADLPPAGFVVIVTRGHAHDLAAMRAIAGRDLRYVGMIGSRAKVARIMDTLAAEGVPPDWLKAVRAPIGLRIGAVTPEEIAVSIVAELIAVRRGAAIDPAGGPASMRGSS